MVTITAEKIIDIFLALTGLCAAIRFRYYGRTAIEQRKKLERFYPKPFRLPEKEFGKTAVVISQIMFLIVGIVFFLIGVAKLFA